MLVSCRVFGGVLVEKNMIFHQHVFFFKCFFQEPVFLSILKNSCLLVYFLLKVAFFVVISSGKGSLEARKVHPKKLLTVQAPADQSLKTFV